MTTSTRRRSTRFLFDFAPLRDGLDSQGNLFALTPAGAVTATFDRGGTTGAATSVDANGRVFAPGYKAPRLYHAYDNASALWTPRGVVLEGSRKHVCLQSEDWSTTWAAVGTPTRVAASDTASGVSLDTIGDDDGAALEGYTQTVTFTGDAVKAVSLFVKAGTSASSVIRLRDTSAGADRLLAAITWSGSIPTATMTTGTYVGAERMAGNVYRLLFSTTSVTAANTNSLQFYPATTAALATGSTGTVLAGGVDAEDGAFPSRYCKTTTVAVTRSADALSFAFNAVPQAMTVYVKGVSLQPSSFDGSFVYQIGTAAGTRLSLLKTNGAATVTGTHSSAAGTVTSAPAAVVVVGDTTEYRTALSATGTVIQTDAVNAGTETVGSTSAANALDAAFGVATLYINSDSTPSNQGLSVVQFLRVAAGVQSIATMRGSAPTDALSDSGSDYLISVG